MARTRQQEDEFAGLSWAPRASAKPGMASGGLPLASPRPKPYSPSAAWIGDMQMMDDQDDEPLIHRIKAEFKRSRGLSKGEDEPLTAEDLARHWLGLVEADAKRRGRTPPGLPEKQAIALRVAQLMQDMDLSKRGRVRLEEWVHYMLLTSSGFASKQINGLLSSVLERNSRYLHDLQQMFDRADAAKTGKLSISSVVEMYSRKLWHLRPGSNAPTFLSNEELKSGDPEKFARDIINAMDLDGDETITYSEFMAYCLGRRKHEVVLHLYDLSNGVAQTLSPYVVGQQLEGIWHTGIVVYGKEYYYAKDTVFDNPGLTSFGEPTRKIHLGHTLWRQDEFHEFVVNNLKPRFHRDTYDVITNNCNHFSDCVTVYLLGRHVPEEVMKQPQWLLQSKFVRVLRPILNWYLRDRITAREKGKDLPPGRPRLDPWEHPEPGTIVSLHPEHEGDAPALLARVGAWDSAAHKNRRRPAMQLSAIWDHCSVSRCGTGGHAFEEESPISVQYFEYMPASSGNGAACQIRTEIVEPHRLSPVDVLELASEGSYDAALRAMGASVAGPVRQTADDQVL